MSLNSVCGAGYALIMLHIGGVRNKQGDRKKERESLAICISAYRSLREEGMM